MQVHLNLNYSYVSGELIDVQLYSIIINFKNSLCELSYIGNQNANLKKLQN